MRSQLYYYYYKGQKYDSAREMSIKNYELPTESTILQILSGKYEGGKYSYLADDSVMFREVRPSVLCSECGKPIYEGQNITVDLTTDKSYCSTDCLASHFTYFETSKYKKD